MTNTITEEAQLMHLEHEMGAMIQQAQYEYKILIQIIEEAYFDTEWEDLLNDKFYDLKDDYHTIQYIANI